jgi:hypothetical protein
LPCCCGAVASATPCSQGWPSACSTVRRCSWAQWLAVSGSCVRGGSAARHCRVQGARVRWSTAHYPRSTARRPPPAARRPPPTLAGSLSNGFLTAL